jgi:hypothetical protein
VYINGVLDSQFSVTIGGSIADSVKIGSLIDDTGTSNNFGGYIDEVRVTVNSDRNYTGSTILLPTAAFPDS